MHTRFHHVFLLAVLALFGCPSSSSKNSQNGKDGGADAGGAGGKHAAGSGGKTGSSSGADASASSSNRDAATATDAASSSSDKDASSSSGAGVSDGCKTCLRANKQGCATVLQGCENPMAPCSGCLKDAYGPGITGKPGSCKDTPVFTMLGACACMYCASECATECGSFWNH